MRSFFSKRIGIIILTIIILAATLVVLSSCIQSGDSDDGQEPDNEQETNDGQDQSEPEYTPTEGLSYELNEDESGYTVSGIGTATDTDIVIPSEYNGLPVTSIGRQAFYNCTSLKSIVIPDSVTSIGNHAFASCISLTSINIPDSVTSIEYFAFLWDCTSLSTIYYNGDIESWLNKDWHSSIMSSGRTLYINNVKTEGALTIPDGVTTIPSYAFAYQNITSVIVPDSVTSIGGVAFFGCTSLTSVTISNSVTNIGDRAFCECTSLTSITVNENNTAYVSIDGNLYNKDKTTLIQYATGKKSTEFTIPDSVTSIGNHAFDFCDSLISIVIPDGVTSIGDWAFHSCTSLTSVVIPDGVTSIGDNAFDFCTSLTDVYYGGTEEQWNGISIGYGNEDLMTANIHFSAADGTQAA